MNPNIESRQDRKRATWQKHIEAWQQSGLSQQSYCQENGIALATFGYWRRKLKRDHSEKPLFFPLVVSAGEPSASEACSYKTSLRVVLGDNRFAIEIDDSFSPAVLQRLIVTLEEL